MFYLKSNSLHIGGVEILFSAPASSKLQIFNEQYRCFETAPAVRTGSDRIAVRLHCGAWPTMPEAMKIFDTRDSWSVYRGADHYWLRLAPIQGKVPLWTARFQRRMASVDIFCQSGPPGKDGTRAIKLPFVYPLDQLLLMHYFSWRQGMLTHSAGMVHGGKAYLFAGVSGAGKSTFSELLVAARIGKVLSDERMIVREIKGEMTAFGTPWAGTALIARNGHAPLAGIFFLKHGEENRIEKLEPVLAADRLLPMISIPWYDPDTATPIIAFAKRVTAVAPCYEFSFTPEQKAVNYFQKFLKEEALPRKKVKGRRKKRGK